jgi:hypothetical protein
MKKLVLSALFFAAIHSPCLAILPPLWQGTAEIKAIIEDKRFGENLQSGEVIEEIKRTETGWLVRTNKNELRVTITYLPATRPGPAQFEMEFEREK